MSLKGRRRKKELFHRVTLHRNLFTLRRSIVYSANRLSSEVRLWRRGNLGRTASFRAVYRSCDRCCTGFFPDRRSSGARNPRVFFQLLETQSINYAQIYSHSLTKSREAYHIINDLLEEKLFRRGGTTALYSAHMTSESLAELAGVLVWMRYTFTTREGEIIHSTGGIPGLAGSARPSGP